MFDLTIKRILLAVSLVLPLLSSSAWAVQCKEKSKTACTTASSCYWVDSYKRKDGVKVKAHCRKKAKSGSSSSSSSKKLDKKKASSKKLDKKLDKKKSTSKKKVDKKKSTSKKKADKSIKKPKKNQ